MQHFEKMDLSHAVYRFYGETGELLYVGCSANPFGGRLVQHGATKSWSREIASATIKWYPGWEAGRKAEAEAILAERPKYNRATVPPENVGAELLYRASRKPKGDGLLCPRCGNPKEVVRPGKAYCRHCTAEYMRARRLKKVINV